MTTYADLADLPEDDRIKVIGKVTMEGGANAFFVEDKVKAKRYIRKLLAWFPHLEVVKKGPMIVKGYPMYFVKVRRVDQGSSAQDN